MCQRLEITVGANVGAVTLRARADKACERHLGNCTVFLMLQKASMWSRQRLATCRGGLCGGLHSIDYRKPVNANVGARLAAREFRLRALVDRPAWRWWFDALKLIIDCVGCADERERFAALDQLEQIANTRSGLPDPCWIFNGAATNIAPVGGSWSRFRRHCSPNRPAPCIKV